MQLLFIYFNYTKRKMQLNYPLNKIYTYISLIGHCKQSEEIDLCESCCSNLELITALKKFKIVENDKSVGKLVYKNAKISDKSGLNENIMILILKTMHAYPDIQKHARKYNYKIIRIN